MLVYSPVGYRFSDFVRIGLPMNDNWEEKLSKCKMDNTATRLGNMNRDLINFITLNMEVIQKGIDEAIASKRKN